MSNQAFNNNAGGNNQVYFNKLVDPPLADLNHGILYELVDGKLYFNGTAIAPILIGNVTSESIPSVTNSIVMYADTTGMNIEESILLVDQNTTNPYPMVRIGVNDPSSPPSATIIGYEDNQGNLIGWGSYMTDTVFRNINVSSNLFFGFNSGLSITGESSTINNIAFGHESLNSLVGGSKNICLGNQSLQHLFQGDNNLAFGDNAGSALNAEEANNVYFLSKGVATENNTTRINDSTSDNPATSCYVGGIYGVSPASPQMVIIDSAGQLGSQNIIPNIFWSGSSILTGANQNIVPGFMSSVVFDAGSEAYCWIPSVTTTVSTFRFAFSRAINIVEVINCRLIVNNVPVLILGSGVWGADFNSSTPQTGSTSAGSVVLNPGDLVCILINAYTSAGNFYMNWTLS